MVAPNLGDFFDVPDRFETQLNFAEGGHVPGTGWGGAKHLRLRDGCAGEGTTGEHREGRLSGFRWQRTRAPSALHLFVPTLSESEPFRDSIQTKPPLLLSQKCQRNRYSTPPLKSA